MTFFPDNVSTFGEAIDSLALLITVLVSIGFFIALGLVLFSIVRFRARPGVKASYIAGESWAQLKWVFIPVAIVLILDFFIDFHTHSAWALIKEYRPSPDLTIRITGQQFAWVFTYPDSKGQLDSPETFQSTGEFHVPVGKNIVFDLEARDVLHSFWVPSLRLKQDAVPGRTIKGWFNATKIGEYDIGCAQICGGGHTNMQARLIVQSEEDFAKWYNSRGQTEIQLTGSGAALDPVAHGLELTKQKGCVACHSSDGSKLVGPSYKGLFMRKELVLTNGAEHEVVADEEYIRRSIKTPKADIVKGFQDTPMPELNLTDNEIADVIQYLKTLN